MSGVRSASAQGSERLQWKFSTGGRIDSSPVVVDDTVFVGSMDGNLYAVDSKTGDEKWASELTNWIMSSPAVADDTVFVGGVDGTLYAVNASTGEQRWDFETGDDITTSGPSVSNGTVYVGSDDSNLYAVDTSTGQRQWVFETGGKIQNSSPTVAGNTVFVGSEDGNLYAIDDNNGEEIWSFGTGGRVVSSPIEADGTVFFGSNDGTLYAVDASTGEEQWGFDAEGFVKSSPMVADGTVFFGDVGSLKALDAETAEKLWEFNTSLKAFRSRPAVSNNTVFAGVSGLDGEGIMYAVDIKNGEQQWAFETKDAIWWSSPTVSDGTVFFGSEDSNLYAVDAQISKNNQNGTGMIPMIATGGGIATLSVIYALSRRRSGQLISKKESSDTDGDTATTVDPESSNRDNGEQMGRVTEKLEHIESQLEEAKQARQNRAYNRAVETAKTAIDSAKTARDIADQLDDNRVVEAESKIEIASDLHNQIKTEQKEYHSVKESLTALSTEVDAVADQAFADGQGPSVEKEELKTIEEGLDDIHATATKYGFDDILDKIAELQQDCEDIRKEIASTDSAIISKISQSVPSPPRLSINYGDIEKGDLIGSGGNADVYHSTVTTEQDLPIALKEPRIGGTVQSETIERIVDEAETWQKLDNHDHIVSVVDYGSNPLPWIGMEYMDGGNLDNRIGEFDFEQALWTAISITKAVRHAHRRGIAHLDLKPANILFREVADAWDVPKVGDWGLSKHLLQHSKSVEGMSPNYAAPEQFDEDFGSADDITDIYQLGTVFYELFTGRPPFEGQTYRVMDKIKNEDPIPPSDIAAVPSELDDILLTALAKDKAARYETVVYLRDELQGL